MAITVTTLYSGTLTAVDTTEVSFTTGTTSLGSQTTVAIPMLTLDVSGITAGYVFQVQAKEKVTSISDPQKIVETWVIGPQGANREIMRFPVAFCIFGWDFTIKKLAGASTVDFKYRIDSQG